MSLPPRAVAAVGDAMGQKRFLFALVALVAGLLIAWVMLANDVRRASATDVGHGAPSLSA